MMVIAIVGILAAVAVPRYMEWSKRSKAVEAKVMLGSIRTNEAEYLSRYEAYTSSLTQLGNPTSGARYYSFSLATSTTDFTGTANPNAAGTSAGLTGTWTVDKGGNFGGTAITSGNNY